MWAIHKSDKGLKNMDHWKRKLHIKSFGILKRNHSMKAKIPDLIFINKKKKNCLLLDSAVPTEHKVKIKECEKLDKYVDIAKVHI